MPATKPPPERQALNYSARQINAAIQSASLSDAQVTATCGICQKTYKKWQKIPDTYTLAQLQRLLKKAGADPLLAASILLGRRVTLKDVTG